MGTSTEVVHVFEIHCGICFRLLLGIAYISQSIIPTFFSHAKVYKMNKCIPRILARTAVT